MDCWVYPRAALATRPTLSDRQLVWAYGRAPDPRQGEGSFSRPELGHAPVAILSHAPQGRLDWIGMGSDRSRCGARGPIFFHRSASALHVSEEYLHSSAAVSPLRPHLTDLLVRLRFVSPCSKGWRRAEDSGGTRFLAIGDRVSGSTSLAPTWFGGPAGYSATRRPMAPPRGAAASDGGILSRTTKDKGRACRSMPCPCLCLVAFAGFRCQRGATAALRAIERSIRWSPGSRCRNSKHSERPGPGSRRRQRQRSDPGSKSGCPRGSAPLRSCRRRPWWSR